MLDNRKDATGEGPREAPTEGPWEAPREGPNDILVL